MGMLWVICSDAARYLGGSKEKAEKLADLVIEISNLPDVLDEYGNPIRNERGAVYWKNLSDWAFTFREDCIWVPDGGDDESDNTLWRRQEPQFRNAIVVAATLLARSERGSHNGFFASNAMIDALEDPTVPDDSERAAKYIPAAAIWVAVGGPRMHQYCLGQLEPDRSALAAAGSLWRGEHEFSLERWSFWKARFQELGESPSLDEKYRELAKQAASQM